MEPLPDITDSINKEKKHPQIQLPQFSPGLGDYFTELN